MIGPPPARFVVKRGSDVAPRRWVDFKKHYQVCYLVWLRFLRSDPTSSVPCWKGRVSYSRKIVKTLLWCRFLDILLKIIGAPLRISEFQSRLFLLGKICVVATRSAFTQQVSGIRLQLGGLSSDVQTKVGIFRRHEGCWSNTRLVTTYYYFNEITGQ